MTFNTFKNKRIQLWVTIVASISITTATLEMTAAPKTSRSTKKISPVAAYQSRKKYSQFVVLLKGYVKSSSSAKRAKAQQLVKLYNEMAPREKNCARRTLKKYKLSLAALLAVSKSAPRKSAPKKAPPQRSTPLKRKVTAAVQTKLKPQAVASTITTTLIQKINPTATIRQQEITTIVDNVTEGASTAIAQEVTEKLAATHKTTTDEISEAVDTAVENLTPTIVAVAQELIDSHALAVTSVHDFTSKLTKLLTVAVVDKKEAEEVYNQIDTMLGLYSNHYPEQSDIIEQAKSYMSHLSQHYQLVAPSPQLAQAEQQLTSALSKAVGQQETTLAEKIETYTQDSLNSTVETAKKESPTVKSGYDEEEAFKELAELFSTRPAEDEKQAKRIIETLEVLAYLNKFKPYRTPKMQAIMVRRLAELKKKYDVCVIDNVAAKVANNPALIRDVAKVTDLPVPRETLQEAIANFVVESQADMCPLTHKI